MSHIFPRAMQVSQSIAICRTGFVCRLRFMDSRVSAKFASRAAAATIPSGIKANANGTDSLADVPTVGNMRGVEPIS
jgi:hypothetical protein